MSNQQLRRNFQVQLQWDRSCRAQEKGEKSEESASGESPVFSAPFAISFIMRTQSTFSRSSSLVLAIRDYSVPRGRSISIGRSSLKSRASIYWVFSSGKIFRRTCLSPRQEAVHRQAFSGRCRINDTTRYYKKFLCVIKIFFKRKHFLFKQHGSHHSIEKITYERYNLKNAYIALFSKFPQNEAILLLIRRYTNNLTFSFFLNQ